MKCIWTGRHPGEFQVFGLVPVNTRWRGECFTLLLCLQQQFTWDDHKVSTRSSGESWRWVAKEGKSVAIGKLLICGLLLPFRMLCSTLLPWTTVHLEWPWGENQRFRRESSLGSKRGVGVWILESFKYVYTYQTTHKEENASLYSFASSNSLPGLTTSWEPGSSLIGKERLGYGWWKVSGLWTAFDLCALLCLQQLFLWSYCKVRTRSLGEG